MKLKLRAFYFCVVDRVLLLLFLFFARFLPLQFFLTSGGSRLEYPWLYPVAMNAGGCLFGLLLFGLIFTPKGVCSRVKLALDGLCFLGTVLIMVWQWTQWLESFQFAACAALSVLICTIAANGARMARDK